MINKDNRTIKIFDGAMGSMIQLTCPHYNGLPEVLNIEQPKIVQNIHKAYVEAGSDIITLNTFGANGYKLRESNYTVKEVIHAAINNASHIKNAHIALDIGPIGQAMRPVGNLSPTLAYEYFKEQVTIAKDRVDLVLIETMSSLLEAKMAVLAVKENSNLPVYVTMTLDNGTHTLMGNDLITLTRTLTALNVDAIGLNCSFGPEGLVEPIKTILAHTTLPVMIQPNAGLPKLVENLSVYDYKPNRFKEQLEKMVNMGVSIIGGCCGTTPEFISEIASLKNKVVTQRDVRIGSYATSSCKTLNLDDSPIIIGERINPTGKKKLKAALKEKNVDYILREAIYQVEAGADILDVNFGLPCIDEKQLYIDLIPELQMVTDVPLQIDTSNLEALEGALRVYEGRPIINSVSGKEKDLKKILPLAKKYGALIVGLTLDEEGLPEGEKGRIKIGHKIIKEALKNGLKEEDILLDCITLSISTNQKDSIDTLKAIDYFKNHTKVKTTLGASNISFGLPNRDLINQTFLTMALSAGLDAPITDPTIQSIRDTVISFKAITGKDVNATRYIEEYSQMKEASKAERRDFSQDNNDIISTINSGLKDETIEQTQYLLETLSPMEIIDEYLIPALNIAGDKFQKKEIYLPQLIRSASCVQEAFKLIKKTISFDTQVSKGKILLATVEGDIHDIGKNIVKVLLENYGYQVIDLGKDVKKEDILKRVLEEDIPLVGLSALMTTTVNSMKNTIELLNEKANSCKIFVGGAVLTEDLSKEIKADFYCKTAQDSVNLAKSFF